MQDFYQESFRISQKGVYKIIIYTAITLLSIIIYIESDENNLFHQTFCKMVCNLFVFTTPWLNCLKRIIFLR